MFCFVLFYTAQNILRETLCLVFYLKNEFCIVYKPSLSIFWNKLLPSVRSISVVLSAGQSLMAMEMLSRTALSYCHMGKNEGAACRSLLTLCKWLLADWKDMTPQLKQARF